MASAPSFISIPRTPTLAILNATGQTFQTFMTAGALGSRIDSIFASNGDSANAYVVQIAVQKSGVDYVLGECLLPIGAGTNGAALSVALLNDAALPGLTFTEAGAMFLETGCSLRIRSKTTVSGANALHFVGVAGDY